MTNVLLNIYEFQESWAFEHLSKVLRPSQRVTLVPLSYRDDWVLNNAQWQAAYGPQGKYFLELAEPFAAYGIDADQINAVNYFTDTPETAAEKMKNADVLFFMGGLPDRMMERLDDMKLLPVLKEYDGIVMGASAGAMIQFGEYHITPDKDYDHFQYHQGLGYLNRFGFEAHYEGSDSQNDGIQRVLAERNRSVFAVGNHGGLLVKDGGIVCMGDVTLYGLEA